MSTISPLRVTSRLYLVLLVVKGSDDIWMIIRHLIASVMMTTISS